MSGEVSGVVASVVVPAYNAAATIGEQLAALRRQRGDITYDVIVADNGSSDETAAEVRRWMAGWPALRLVDAASRRGSAYARNVGAAQAVGQWLAFCDADDIVDDGWLEALAEYVRPDRVVFGTLRVDSLNSPSVLRWRSSPHAASLAEPGPSDSFAPSGNMAIYRSTYLHLGGLNEEYPKSHDVEFAVRVRKAGLEIFEVPGAVVNYRYRSTLRAVYRQAYRGGRAVAQLRAEHGSSLAPRSARTTMRAYWWLLSRLPLLLTERRGLWVASVGGAIGRISGSVRYRVWSL
ncbi:MAG: glycosyltransferase [Ilumatobacter sp.]|nr:glycosyltransferase [Ilumatobacter sp.]